MRKSSANGKNTSARKVEVLNVSPFGMWLLIGQEELLADFKRFPFFADATIRQLGAVTLQHGTHLRWNSLDVDLHIDSLRDPDRFPLVARQRRPAAR